MTLIFLDSIDPLFSLLSGPHEIHSHKGNPEIGVSPTVQHPHVWGVLMETGFPEGLATLVALGDGTVSLYLGHGGGDLRKEFFL